MAFESRFWRTQIKKDVRFIKNKLVINIHDVSNDKLDQIFSQIEIKLFIITYSLRKLMDTKKIPDKINEVKIKVVSFGRNNRKPIRPFSLFDDYYELDNKSSQQLTLREICNQFTHAFFFQLCGNSSSRIKNIFFVSDYDKEKNIYSIKIDTLLNHIMKVVDKYPKCISIKINGEQNKYVVTCK